MSSKIRIPLALVALFTLLICIAICWLLAGNTRERAKSEITAELNKMLGGKTAISDFELGNVSGKLRQVYIQRADEGPTLYDLIRTKDTILAFVPSEVNPEGQREFPNVPSWQKQYELYSQLVEYYDAGRAHAFTTAHLSHDRYNDNAFRLERRWGNNMGYKVGVTKELVFPSSLYSNSHSYSIPTHRPSISECYREAARFITVENEDGSYKAGSFSSIIAFPRIENDFFYLNGPSPVDAPTDNASEFKSQSLREVVRGEYVFTSEWVVWYSGYDDTYLLTEKKGVFMKKWLTYSAIAAFVIGLAFLVVRFRNRITIS